MANTFLQFCKLSSRNCSRNVGFRAYKFLNSLSLVSGSISKYPNFITSSTSSNFRVPYSKTGSSAVSTRAINQMCYFQRIKRSRNFSVNRTTILKNWKTEYSKSSNLKSSSNSDDDDDDVIKVSNFKKRSQRRRASKDNKNVKFSTQVQKAGNALIRPSRYAFTELNGQDEELRWVKRHKETDASKSRVEWYANQMVRLTSEHQVDKAQELFNTMRLKKIRPTTEIFNILISGYGKSGNTRKAFHYYNNIKKMALQPSAHTYTSLFNICAEMKSREVSLSHLIKLWEEFQKKVKNQDLKCDVITYNAAMKAAVTCQSLSIAIDIYDDMCLNNVEPECRTYSSLLVACAQEGDPENVLWVLKEMKEHNVKPDLFVFNSLLRAIRDSRLRTQYHKQNGVTLAVKRGSFDQIKISERTALLDSNLSVEEDVSLDNTNPKDNPLNISSEDYSTAPKVFTGVEDYLQLMAVNDVLPDIRTFHLLLQVADLEVEEEEYILRLMKEWEIKPDLPVLNALVKRRALYGDVEKAEAYIKMFENKLGVSPSKNTYYGLARGCRNTSDGLWLLNEMKKRGFVPDIAVLGRMIKNATHRKDFQFLTELLKEMSKSQIQPTVEILDQLDNITNKSINKEQPVTRNNGKFFKREQKKSQFRRKQQLGFYGFYKTWKYQIDKLKQNEDQKQDKMEKEWTKRQDKETEEDKEDINYDHL